MKKTRVNGVVAVFGGNDDAAAAEHARALGALLGPAQMVLLTGGTGPNDSGVKGAAIAGAKDFPWIGVDRSGKVAAVEQGSGLRISTDLDHKRNYLEAALCDIAVCLSGGDGTVSEATFALALGRPVAFWGDDWSDKLHFGGPKQPLAVEWMIERTMKRVGDEPTGRRSIDTFINRRGLAAKLAKPPPFAVFGSSRSASKLLRWVNSNITVKGGFPKIAGYEAVGRDFDAWLARCHL